MPAATRTELKAFFETGDVPTEAQFANLIDSLAHVNDGLRSITVSGDTTFEIPVGKSMIWLGVLCNANETIKIGSTGVGTDDILFEQAVTAGQDFSITTTIWARASVKTIYVTGTDLTLTVREVITAEV